KLLRASTHASGTPITSEIAVAADAVHSESTSAWVASEPLSAAARLPQGARMSSPASGRTRKATAISAGASKGAGTDRGPPPGRGRRRARGPAAAGGAPGSLAARQAGRRGQGTHRRYPPAWVRASQTPQRR